MMARLQLVHKLTSSLLRFTNRFLAAARSARRCLLFNHLTRIWDWNASFCCLISIESLASAPIICLLLHSWVSYYRYEQKFQLADPRLFFQLLRNHYQLHGFEFWYYQATSLSTPNTGTTEGLGMRIPLTTAPITWPHSFLQYEYSINKLDNRMKDLLVFRRITNIIKKGWSFHSTFDWLVRFLLSLAKAVSALQVLQAWVCTIGG